MTTEIAIPPSSIGRMMSQKMKKFEALEAKIRDVTEGEFDDLLKRIDDPLHEAIAGVAVIGQVKAGKTSLLNGFMGKQEFLPSDVNPWTAVVTNMYFGKPGGPHEGARFLFFDDEQWKKFSSRDGRLAELANSIPGGAYDMEDIVAEVNQMRERAELRLGDQFHQLLGKAHKFSTASTDVLARYICAGDDPEQLVKNPVMGRFADITREANVYFGTERFGYPLRLIDTPGLNDPLLIREEITLQCLEDSDIFVLVLSAHQAFTSSDLYLLRVLNALRLDRLVIFVNRVDELTNPSADIPDILKHIRGMLAKENPEASIPVLFGSAVWAEYATGGDVEFDSEKATYFAKGRTKDITAATDAFGSEERAKAWVASGLPTLDRAITELMDNGIGETWLKSARIDLNNMLEIVGSDTKRRIQALERQIAIMNDEIPPDAAVSEDQSNFEDVEDTIGSMFTRLKVTLEAVSSDSFNEVQRGLRNLVEEFIAEETVRFKDFFATTKKKKSDEGYSIDPTPLRSSMNVYFRTEFPIVQTKILAKLDEESEELSRRMVEMGIEEAANIKVNTAKLADDAPNTTALSKAVSFDMGSKYWKGWFGKFKSDDEVIKSLGKMIRSQFLPVETELLENATDKLVESSSAAINSFQSLQKALLSTRRGQAQHGAEELTGSMDELRERIEKLQSRAETCAGIAGELEAA